MSSIYDRLTDLGISLPPLAIPAAAYLPFVQTGSLVFISGHIAKKDGKPWVGQLGLTMTTDEGKAARARRDRPDGHAEGRGRRPRRVKRIVKVMSLVNSTSTSPSSTWSPTAAPSCWARSSARPASTPAAPSAWRRSRWAPASRSS